MIDTKAAPGRRTPKRRPVLIDIKRLGNSDTVRRSRGKIAHVTTPFIKPNRLNGRVGSNLNTIFSLCKRFRKPKQNSTMAQSLQIVSDGQSPEPRHLLTNVYSDDADDRTFVKKYERMIAGFGIVRMIFDVAFELTAILKEHLAANVMERKPLSIVARRSEFVFSLDHLEFRGWTLLDRSVFTSEHE